ncbi:D-2-hydroxyacid dehydrogenase family protein [Lichenifustis flavocetrariae]|uniref:D-2-hydroxyacid dehydrogenase family protein n=1 Tax=Lichenifustis flavocetrariae TaxID=2949735 RepID=A0AA41Z2U6_9HYPH|nr:D-2-hydroxyacid dehydrogenase family protein [Lichenifustis flavocetrariae]MCW6513184.1 D-2-hydroxyacid dehydrogenase family protein [Lichenifustis flavocetrariae]
MVKIAVLDDWQDVARRSADWSALEVRADVVFFADALGTEEEAAGALAEFDILMTMRERTAMPDSLLARLPKLRMIGITGGANASLDMQACARRGITVCNTTGGAPTASWATAELALGLLIAAARAIPAADATMRAGGFQHGVPVGIGLAGKTLGILGLGRLGTRMARYGAALDMNVIAWSPNLTEKKAREAGARLVGKDDLMATSDAISIHMVLSPRSRGIVGAADIARLKHGAILVNTSRGPLVDEAALVAAVQASRIIAALDVFDTEPLPKDHPFRAEGATVLTPHLGYGVAETWHDFYPKSVENALAFLDGTPIRVVGPS